MLQVLLESGLRTGVGMLNSNAARMALATLAATALAAAPAQAGPWTMTDGEGRVISSFIYSHSAKSFDSSGDSTDAPDYDQLMAFFLTEYGLNDDVTLIVNPGVKWVGIEGGDDEFGIDSVELGARYRLYHDDRLVISAQASGFVPGTLRNEPVPQISGNRPQFEARLQLGYGFNLGKLSGFASAEGGYRIRTGAPPDEFRGDATLGIHASDRLMLIGNLFNTWSNGAGQPGFPSYRYANLYAGGVYKLSPRLSFQLGGLATLTGRNALRERGLYSGFWIKF